MSLNLTLVTEDRHLLEVVAEAGGSVISLEEFLASICAEGKASYQAARLAYSTGGTISPVT